MDPDTNLEEMRRCAREVLENDDEGAAFRLAELVEAIDGWLSRGGFLPKEWAR